MISVICELNLLHYNIKRSTPQTIVVMEKRHIAVFVNIITSWISNLLLHMTLTNTNDDYTKKVDFHQKAKRLDFCTSKTLTDFGLMCIKSNLLRGRHGNRSIVQVVPGSLNPQC